MAGNDTWGAPQPLAGADDWGAPQPLKADDWGQPQPLQSNDAWGEAQPVQADDRSVLDQIAEGAALGFKRATTPQDVTPEEYNRKQTAVEAVADMVTNIGTGIAVPAAVAGGAALAGVAAPAAAVAGTVASVAYGLYSAFGGEKSRAEAEGQEFNPARAAGQAFLEINPLIRGGSKAVKAARVAAQIATAGANEYSYTGDSERAAVAGGFTLLAAPLMLYGMRSPKVTRETFAGFEGALQLPEGKRLAADAAAKFEAGGPGARSLFAASDVPKDFMLQMAPGKAKSVQARFDQWRAQTAPAVQDEQWEIYNRSRALGEAANKAAARQLAGLDPELKDISKARKLAAPAEYVGRRFDTITGGDLEGDLAAHARDVEKTDTVMFTFGSKFRELAAKRNRLKIPADQISRAVDPKMPGHAAALKAVQARGGEDLLGDYRQALLLMRDAYIQAGGGSKYRLLNKSKTGADVAVAAETEIKRLAKAAPDGRWWESPDASRLKEIAANLTGRKVDELTPSDLMKLPALLQGSKHSLLDDLGEIPESIREFDIDKLAARFLNGSLKPTLLEPSINRVAAYIPVAETLGMRNTSAWLQDFVGRANGVQGTWPKHWNAAMESIRKVGLRALAEDPDSKWGKLLERLPGALAKANAMAYPSFLAYNPKAAIRQSAQNLGVTAPHLGGFTGYRLVTEGHVRTANDVGMSPTALREFLRSKGQLGGIMGDVGEDASVGVAVKALRTAEKVNEAGMAAFQYGELVNRTVSYKTGEAWADLLLKGDKGALKALAGSSTGLKARIQTAGGVDVPREELRHILGEYLVGMTQFRYGPATQAMALAHAGSAFSQFTKWPLMTTWDLVEQAQKGPSVKAAQAFAARLAPLTALWLVKQKLDEHKNDQAWLPVMTRWLVGDPTEWSPVASVTSLTSIPQGGPMVKTVLSAASELAKAGRSDKPSREVKSAVREGARNFLKTYVPVVSPAFNELDRESQAGLLKKLKLELEGGPGSPTPSKDLVRMFPFLGED